MPYDPTNRRDVKTAQKQAKVQEQQRKEDVNGIMSVEPGRKWMCELLEHCHIFSTSYSDVTARMAFMEGQREVGILLLTDIMGACPDQYVLMMRERNERSSTDDIRFSRPGRGGEDTDGRHSDPDADNRSEGDDAPDIDDSERVA